MTAPKAAHTPGPWRVSESHGQGRIDIRTTQSQGVQSYPLIAETTALSVPYIEAKANARLIAAAPEMAETLEQTDIAITNLLQIYGEHAIIDGARAKLKIQRDRIRALLARIDGTAP